MQSIDHIVLTIGRHANFEQGVCAMELVAHMAGLPHSDAPPCTSSVLAAFTRTANDSMPYDARQKLKAVLPRLLNTNDPAKELARAEVLAWSAISVFAATALRVAGLVAHADKLANFVGTLSAVGDAAHAAANYIYATNYAAADAATDYAAHAAADAARAARAADAASYAASAADAASYTVADAVSYAASAASYAASAAARAADAASYAVADAASYAASAADAVAARAANSTWDLAIEVLVQAIDV